MTKRQKKKFEQKSFHKKYCNATPMERSGVKRVVRKRKTA